MAEASAEGQVVSVVERAISEQAHSLTRAGKMVFVPDPEDASQRILDGSFGPLIRMGKIAAPDISPERITAAVVAGVESAEAALAKERSEINDINAQHQKLLAELAKLRQDFLDKFPKINI